MSACHCGLPGSFESCCKPRHDGTKPAETAEALMRSRYSAFAVANGKYLVATRTGERRFGEATALETWARSVMWLGLEVLRTEQGREGDSEGLVHFVARSIEDGQLVRMEEPSRFVKVDGQWRYVDGEPESSSVKLERNDPCPCNSGKKYKQCHASR